MTLMIDFPFPGVAPWVDHFKSIEVPVLRHTVHQLAELRETANTINTRKLATVIAHDPLMTLRLFQYMQANRSRRQSADITTIERSLVMIGTQNFYDSIQDPPILEQQLKGYPKAMLGLLKVIARSRAASQWARDWALLRQNVSFDEIAMAALLHDLVEILLWCFAPNLAIRAKERLASEPGRRSSQIQEEVFGAPLDQIAVELITHWGLPPLLCSLLDPADAEVANVRNVKLAVNLARHSANGWNDAALPDDYREIEALLHIGHSNLLERIGAPEEQVLAARQAEAEGDPLAS
ncbi:MAG: HDOD domain-containing protein [Gammaproteobacteria bacterium]|nr:HDOD domain-containing protein [Gammaproteobacteria bacterium]MBU1601633.1 HDOD domain-containing protein [Gammaproteobacteria bacterium]MBU2434711.1 HDOD domain-containing protein [Gammaproteobacteria bacterium]MBU2447952.1 HDOD domain-containing protein [Gammaproteobacteria bacterium]